MKEASKDSSTPPLSSWAPSCDFCFGCDFCFDYCCRCHPEKMECCFICVVGCGDPRSALEILSANAVHLMHWPRGVHVPQKVASQTLHNIKSQNYHDSLHPFSAAGHAFAPDGPRELHWHAACPTKAADWDATSLQS